MSDSDTPSVDYIYRQFESWLFNNQRTAQFSEDEYKDMIIDMLATDTATGSGFLATFMRLSGYVSAATVSELDEPEADAQDSVRERAYATMMEGQAAILEATLDMASIKLEQEGPKWSDSGADGETPEENKLIAKLLELKIIDDEVASYLAQIVNSTGLTGGLLMGAILIGIALKSIGIIGEISGGDFYKDLLARFTPNVPGGSELLKPLLLSPDNEEPILQAIRENGLNQAHIDMLRLNSEHVFDPEDVKRLYWRKLIDLETAKKELARSGMTPDRIALLVETWTVIPSIQDLLFMVAKEAFEPDQIAIFGLGAEFPNEQVEWMEKQGLSREWALRFWYAHWNPPSLQMGFEMLHRGFLDDEGINALFRVHEIPPYFRERLKGIAYRPLTRVDVRRIYRAGKMNIDQVKRSYLDLGYNDENAQIMTDWTESEYGQEEKSLTRSQIESAYADGILSEPDAITLLVQVGYNPDQAQWITNNVELQEVKRLQDKVIGVIESQFLNHMIDEVQARTELGKQDVSSARVDVYLMEWELERELDVKLPSKTDLSKFFKAEVIDETQYREFLLELGYDNAIAQMYIKYDKGKQGD